MSKKSEKLTLILSALAELENPHLRDPKRVSHARETVNQVHGLLDQIWSSSSGALAGVAADASKAAALWPLGQVTSPQLARKLERVLRKLPS